MPLLEHNPLNRFSPCDGVKEILGNKGSKFVGYGGTCGNGSMAAEAADFCEPTEFGGKSWVSPGYEYIVEEIVDENSVIARTSKDKRVKITISPRLEFDLGCRGDIFKGNYYLHITEESAVM